jgi:uncharacterized protein
VRWTGVQDAGAGAGSGVVSGLFGVGGGIVLVPYLSLVRGWDQKHAQATSLVSVAMAATAALTAYAFSGSVAWLAALPILAGGLIGAVIGSAIVHRLESAVLRIAFALLLVVIAIRLVTEAGSADQSTPPALTAALAIGYFVSGVAMGTLSALFGIGGGILLVPILVTLFDYGQLLAAGTSLAVMGPIALVGALRQTASGATNWRVGALLGIGAAVGGVVGARLAAVLPLEVLTWLFAGFIVLVAVRLGWEAWRERSAPAAEAIT